jgi:putative CocE/NonD family hydrolase
MRDGVKIAVEIYVPDPLHARAPTIVRQTRYLRALAPRLAALGGAPAAFDLYARTRRVFLAAGYAWVDVDVRGSGASMGTQPYPWTTDEVKDGAEVVDFVVSEPWSNGKVGALGISYDGTAAEMLLVNQHPAVLAAAPLFSLFDAYTDVAFPGGVHLSWFTEAWARYNAALDRGAFAEAYAPVVRLIARAAACSPTPRGADRLIAPLGRLLDGHLDPIVSGVLARTIVGVAPVDGDHGGADLRRAIADHAANFSVHDGALRMAYRDDRGISPAAPDGTIDLLSPRCYTGAIAGSGAAIYSYSGWRDAAYPNAAIKRQAQLGGARNRLTIGPWTHSGKQRIRPFDVATVPDFDHDAELLGFFDEHLRAKEHRGDRAQVHYFTFGEERWKSCTSWPPAFAPCVLVLAPGGCLEEGYEHASVGEDALAVDPTAGTGERSRWRSLLSLVPGDYPDRRERDAHLLVYDTLPLDGTLEVTGHPVAVLFVSWDDDDDGRVFVYLEDVAPDGRVAYVTEGQLRAVHRRLLGPRAPGALPERSFLREHAMPLSPGDVGELDVELLPISWRFERGHRVRLAIAGGDADHFQRSRASTLRIHRSAHHPSRLELPVPSERGTC